MKEVEAKTETFTPQIHKLAPEEHENINGWMKNGREKGKQIRGTLWCESDFQTDEQWRTLGVKCWVGGGGGPGLEGQLGCVEGSPSEEELNRQIRANGPWWRALDPTACAPLNRHESRYS